MPFFKEVVDILTNSLPLMDSTLVVASVSVLSLKVVIVLLLELVI